MPISKETKERIAQDAEDNRPANEGMLRRQGFVDGYIAGGEAEAERAQPVIEALEHLINDVRRKPNDSPYASIGIKGKYYFIKDRDLERFAVNILKALGSKKLAFSQRYNSKTFFVKKKKH